MGRTCSGLGLAALGQDDHVVERDLAAPQPIHQGQQPVHRHGDVGERSAQLDLARLDALADLDLLPGVSRRTLPISLR